MPKKTENQSHILYQLSLYLDIVSKERPMVYRAYDVKDLKKKLESGYCSGFTAFWFYYRRRNKKSYFYQNITYPILNWNGSKDHLTPELRATMEEALSSIQWMQAALSTDFLNTHLLRPGYTVSQASYEQKIAPYAPIKQTDYDVLLGVIKQKDYPDIRKKDEIAFVFTNEEFKDLLQDLPANKDIRLGNGTHAIGLFFDAAQQQYTLFNANGFLKDPQNPTNTERSFEKYFHASHMDDLIQNIQNALFLPPQSTMIGVCISVFDDTPDAPQPDRVSRIKSLLDNRAKQNHNDNTINTIDAINNNTALHLAAHYGHLDVVTYLVNQKADSTLKNKKKSTPLQLAAAAGHLSIVHTLLEYAKKTVPDYTTQVHIALYHAVEGNHLPIVEFLLQQEYIDLASIPKNTTNPLNIIALAAQSGNQRLLEMLLKTRGGFALINESVLLNGIATTPLYLAAEYNHPHIIEILLKNGGYLYNPLNQSSLHIAAQNNNIAALKILLQSPEGKKWVNVSISEKGTPLYYAVCEGHLECVELLLQAGANPKITTTGDQKSIIEYALEKAHFKIVDCLLRHNRKLLYHIGLGGATLLHLSINTNNIRAVQCVLKHGIELEKTTDNGDNALHIAVSKENTAIVSLLLQDLTSSELIDAPNDIGLTPLQIAQAQGYTEIVQILEQAKQQITQAQTQAHQKAKQQIKKHWIDKDHFFLVQIQTLYLLEETRLARFKLELMEISKYFGGTAEPLTVSGIDTRLARLEAIESIIQHLQSTIEYKSRSMAYSITDDSRRCSLIHESEHAFIQIVQDLQHMKKPAASLKSTLLARQDGLNNQNNQDLKIHMQK